MGEGGGGLFDGKGVVDRLYLVLGSDLVGGDGEAVAVHVDDRVAGQPVLAALGNIVLLGGDQLVEFGAGGRVGGHVKGALGIDHGVSGGVLDGVAAVVRLEGVVEGRAGGIALLGVQGDLLVGLGVEALSQS